MGDPRVLVTGASGFIGGHLTAALAAQGAEVHGVSRQPRPESSGLRWWQADLARRAEALRLVGELRPEVVIHLASEVTGRRELDAVAPTFAANLASTVHLLEAAVTHSVGRLVLTGSSEEPDAGDPEAIPPSPYAAAKWAAAGYARLFRALYDAPVVTAKLFMVYGPAQRDLAKLVPYVTLALLRGEAPLLTSGTRPVDWIHVDDVVAGLTRAAFGAGLEGSTLELGSGALTSVRAVVGRLHALIGGPAPRFGALPDRPLERIRAARRSEGTERAGWSPRIGLAAGLAETVDWYRRALADGAL